jgi:hypothetical protein
VFLCVKSTPWDQLEHCSAGHSGTLNAKSKGFDVEPGSEVFTVLIAGDALVDVDTAPDSLVVRCTVKLVGEGSDKIHAEGPMNG